VAQQLKPNTFSVNKSTTIIGLIFIAFAIVMGAFGAHYFENVLEPKQLKSLRTGVDYQFYAGIVLLILGLNYNAFNFSIKLPALFFVIGACCFSFSLYAISLFYQSGVSSYVWPVTPIGGLLMILAVILLLYKVIKND